jgi:ribosome biogenesis GTPase
MMQDGEDPAVPTGKLLYGAKDQSELPVVGDWVASQIVGERDPTITIHGVLPRKSALCRKEAGTRTQAQVLAANIDTLFLMVGLDGNFSLNRVERYLMVAWSSGANPVVLLTKSDLRDDFLELEKEARLRSNHEQIFAISSVTGFGMEALAPYLVEGMTVALIGSSGVGKSTLLNSLAGEDVQKVQEVREFDSKGRHTTTNRQIFRLRSGAMLIDTPGLRELQLWDTGDGIGEVFEDIEDLGKGCRYADCLHKNEPGCAVREAVESGQLDMGRLQNYWKLKKEVAYLERKQSINVARQSNRRWKQIAKIARHREEKWKI